jgi:dethiobiotin synthase
MRARGVFVTGTDTAIGKTTFSALLISMLKRAQMHVRYFKPIQTGADSDTDAIARLSGLNRDRILESSYQFVEPMAPYRAAELNGHEIEIDPIKREFFQAMKTANDFWVVEGVGGLLVPINSRQTVRDLALSLELPLLIVASTRLGTINHILLTVEAARSAGCLVLGLVLNGEDDPGLADLLARLTNLPLLAKVAPINKISAKSIGELADVIIPSGVLEQIFSQKRR